MAVKLRLKRMGAKQRPFYRLVAADARCPRDGKFIETVGTYDPIKEPAIVTVDEEKIMKWLSLGAIPTETVRTILKGQGIMKKFADTKTKKAPKKKVASLPKKEEKTVEKKATTVKKTTTTAAKKTTKKATTKTKKEA